MTALPPRGDLALTLGPVDPLGPVRGAWSELASGPGWSAAATAGGDGWAGYLLSAVPANGWNAWLVGEAAAGGGLVEAASILDHTTAGDNAGAEKAATAFNGSWLLVGRDTAGCLHVWSDRFATIHCFVASNGSRVALSTCQDAAAAAVGHGSLDWEAITVWCALGFYPGDRTGDSRVSVVRPATHVRLAADGTKLDSSRYWWWDPAPDTRRSETATITALDDVLAVTLRDHADGVRLALPISGGLDSRTAVAVATAHEGRRGGGSLWSYSYGYEESSVETRIAGQIAAARHLPFAAWTTEPYLLSGIERAARVLEGAQDLTQTRQLGVVDQISARADRVIAAHWGDVWLDGMGFADREAGPDEVFDYLRYRFTKFGGEWLVDMVCRAHVPEPEALINDVLRDEFSAYRDIPGADAQARAFKTDQWSFRWTVPSLRAYHAGLAPRLPFYDGRVADFMLTVPPSMVAGRRLQIEHLRRTAPDLARITWQESGTSLEQLDKAGTWLLPQRLARGARRRIGERLRGTPVLSRNWEVQFGGQARRDELERQLLQAGGAATDLVSPEAIRRLLIDFGGHPHDARLGYAVAALRTLSAWLERR